VMRLLVRTLRVDRSRAAALHKGGYLEALGVADYLTRAGLPFREAHRVAGAAVRRAEALGVGLPELPLSEYKALSPKFGPDLHQAIRLEGALARNDVPGGTAPARVRAEVARLVREFPPFAEGPPGPQD